MAFKSFAEYMAAKTSKQQNQNSQSRNQISTIFKGCFFYFDGYLGQLSLLQWKQLVLDNGADVSDYLNSKTTHIIAPSLTLRKTELWKLKKVVKPEWITDSIAANKLLSWVEYAIIKSKEPSVLDWISNSPNKSASHLLPESRPGNSSSEKTIQQSSPRNKTILDWISNSPKNSKASSLKASDDRFQLNSCLNSPVNVSLNVSEVPLKNSIVNERKNTLQTSTSSSFIESYYESSRLSKLSLWKQSLIDYISQKPPKQVTESLEKTLFYIDMDCFFASASTIDSDQSVPVAVCHSKGTTKSSTSEIACVNYPARQFGIRNGMLLQTAKLKCPHIKVVPYDFALYEKISKVVYDILYEYCSEIMVISCDEACISIYLDGKTPLDLASEIRNRIKLDTGCNASIGISHNILLSKLAVKKAKPNGVFIIDEYNCLDVLKDMAVDCLPGVGYALKNQMGSLGIHNCGDLYTHSLKALKKEFGDINGLKFYEYARGIDERSLQNKQRQSVGSEINWGIRFTQIDEVKEFLSKLSNEVFNRMKSVGSFGKHLTLKVKKRLYEGEPSKFLGCGNCLDLSKSKCLQVPFVSEKMIFKEVWILYKEFGLVPDEVRGLGIHISKLVENGKNGQTVLKFKPIDYNHGNNRKESENILLPPKEPVSSDIDDFNFVIPSNSQIDWDVVDELPEEIVSRIKSRKRKERISDCIETEPHIQQNEFPTNSQIDWTLVEELPEEIRNEIKLYNSNSRSSKQAEDVEFPTNSQIDWSLVSELPLEIRAELNDFKKKNQASKSKNSFEFDEYDVIPSQVDKSVIEELPVVMRKAIERKISRKKKIITVSVPKLNGVSNFEEVLNLIHNWLQQYDEPFENDIIKLCMYLSELVKNLDGDQALEIVNIVRAKSGDKWKLAARNIIDKVNEAFLSVYGGTMKLLELE